MDGGAEVRALVPETDGGVGRRAIVLDENPVGPVDERSRFTRHERLGSSMDEGCGRLRLIEKGTVGARVVAFKWTWLEWKQGRRVAVIVSSGSVFSSRRCREGVRRGRVNNNATTTTRPTRYRWSSCCCRRRRQRTGTGKYNKGRVQMGNLATRAGNPYPALDY